MSTVYELCLISLRDRSNLEVRRITRPGDTDVKSSIINMPQHVLAGMISIPSFAWEPTSSKLHMAVVTTRWNEPGTLHHCVIGKHGNVESSHLIASGTDIDWPTLGTPGIMIRIGAVVVTAAT